MPRVACSFHLPLFLPLTSISHMEISIHFLYYTILDIDINLTILYRHNKKCHHFKNAA